MILTGVSSHFCAAHRDERGRMHGHSYKVTAWFPAGRDAVALQGHLEAALRVFDHKDLPDDLATAESIVGALSNNLPAATEILIERPLEGLLARWTA